MSQAPRIGFLRVLALVAAFGASGPSATAQAVTLTTLYNFTFGSDGAYPYGTLAVGNEGALYGLATGGPSDCGGEPNCGIVFQLKPPVSPNTAWIERMIYTFPAGSGTLPGLSATSLVMGKNGELYGTFSGGAASDYGGVFELTAPASRGGPWTYTTLYNFLGGSDGSYPSGVVVGSQGQLYGTTTEGGGPAQAGAVFELTPPTSPGGRWTETLIYAFQGLPDGSDPLGGVAIGSNGVLAGTTHFGGTGACAPFGEITGCGTLFELSPPASPGGAWTESLLFSLGLNAADGWYPWAGAVISPGGELFTTTDAGGLYGNGSPIELTRPANPEGPWTETVLVTFVGRRSPANVSSPLLAGPKGTLFGSSAGSGAYDDGMIFELRPPASAGGSWLDVRLYSFTGGSDGYAPSGGLTIGLNQAFYGVTLHGGASPNCLNLGCGTVFSLKLE